MTGDPPNGPAMCIHDDGHPVERSCDDPYCHACEIQFERWVFELTDDRPEND